MESVSAAAFPEVHTPVVLPRHARQSSVVLDASDCLTAVAFDAILLPDDLQCARPSRQLQFRAGRACALAALRSLAPSTTFGAIGRHDSGAAAWPDGFTGSITHTEDYASAAVAWACDAAALAIDTERIVGADTAERIGPAVAYPSEMGAVQATGCTRFEALTIVFSAKETIFKCLHHQVGRVFGFHDVRIVDASTVDDSFEATVVQPLSPEFPAGTELRGHFSIDASRVHTGMLLEARADARR